MAGQLQGSSTEVVIGFETAYGVPDTTGFMIPMAPTSSAMTSQAINSSSVINGSASPSQPFLGFKDGKASFTIPVDDKAFAYWLKGLFGSPTTTGAGPYLHTYKIGTTIPSMFIEINHTDATGGLFYMTKGIGLNTLSFSLGGDGELLATIEGIAKDTTKTTTTAVTTLITDVTDGIKFGQFTAAITGATNVKTFDLNYGNNVDADTYVIDGTGSRGGVPKGIADVSGSFTTLFEDDSIFASSRAFTDFPLDVTLTSGTSILKFDMEEAKLDAVTNPEIAGAAGLIGSFNFQAYLNSGANATALQVELTNTIAVI